MRVTEKSRIAIAKAERRRLRFKSGSEVEFVLREEAVLRTVGSDVGTSAKEVAELMAHIRSFAGTMDLGGATPDEFMALLRG
jgi:bifunctional DNA-binding transcriptional regulator/antitoxin component of YhaV-PrlF toxin-antitoxin module